MRETWRERERERTTSPGQKLTGSSLVHKLALEEETWKQEQITISTRDLATKNTYLGMLTTGGYWMQRSGHPGSSQWKKCAAKLLSGEQNADETLTHTTHTSDTVSHTYTKLDYLLWMKSAHKTTLRAVDEICTPDCTLCGGWMKSCTLTALGLDLDEIRMEFGPF